MCFTSSCEERGSLAMAQRQDPIIRTQFSWLAGNLPLGWKSNYCLWKANLASNTSGVFSPLFSKGKGILEHCGVGAISCAWCYYCFMFSRLIPGRNELLLKQCKAASSFVSFSRCVDFLWKESTTPWPVDKRSLQQTWFLADGVCEWHWFPVEAGPGKWSQLSLCRAYRSGYLTAYGLLWPTPAERWRLHHSPRTPPLRRLLITAHHSFRQF